MAAKCVKVWFLTLIKVLYKVKHMLSQFHELVLCSNSPFSMKIPNCVEYVVVVAISSGDACRELEHSQWFNKVRAGARCKIREPDNAIMGGGAITSDFGPDVQN